MEQRYFVLIDKKDTNYGGLRWSNNNDLKSDDKYNVKLYYGYDGEHYKVDSIYFTKFYLEITYNEFIMLDVMIRNWDCYQNVYFNVLDSLKKFYNA